MDEPFSPTKPIYLQLVERIAKAIVRGDLMPGGKLPSVRETAITYGVNPNTAQRVYAELERQAVVETRRGQGTFVTEDGDRLAALRHDLLTDAIQALVNGLAEMGVSECETLQSLARYLAEHRHTHEGGSDDHDPTNR